MVRSPFEIFGVDESARFIDFPEHSAHRHILPVGIVAPDKAPLPANAQDASPFPLGLRACADAESPAVFIQSTLKKWGGIRFPPKIGKLAAANIGRFEGRPWHELETKLAALATTYLTRDDERTAARWVARHFKGLGPKQSRNFLQWLGLTRYEIPLDSRVIRWANEFGFPVRLSSKGLTDENYYSFVLDGISVSRSAMRRGIPTSTRITSIGFRVARTL